jgi:SulP family sulfate permease
MSGDHGTRRLLPPTLRNYRRSWLGPDIVAGFTLAAIALPSQMATARLADMPAVTGLYAFVVGSVAFALVGCGRQVTVGADSTIAPVLAAGVAVVASPSHGYPDLMAFLALMVGVLVALVGLARLGWMADFLSAPVISGVLAGIAITIVVRQLPAVLGLPGGGTTLIGRLHHVVDQLGSTNGWALGIAVGVLVVSLTATHVDPRLSGALIGLVASIVVVTGFGLEAHGVKVLGAIRGGLPPFAIPTASWADVRRLLAPALTVAFICVAQTSATGRESRYGTPSPREFNRDLIALGAGNLAAGLTGSFAVDSSPPNTAIVGASGGRSQGTNLVAATVVGAIVLFATAPLDKLPEASLGALLIFVATRLFHFGDLRAVLRFDRIEFSLGVVTMLVVALAGIEQGVIVAMLLSLASRTWRTARPRDAILGREPGTDHWVPSDIGQPTEHVDGVVVYLLYAPLWYGNASYVRLRVHAIVSSTHPAPHALVIDADGIADVDYTGLRALAELVTELKAAGVSTGVARASHLVHHDLKHGALLAELGADHIFDSVEAAVERLAPKPHRGPVTGQGSQEIPGPP